MNSEKETMGEKVQGVLGSHVEPTAREIQAVGEGLG